MACNPNDCPCWMAWNDPAGLCPEHGKWPDIATPLIEGDMEKAAEVISEVDKKMRRAEG